MNKNMNKNMNENMNENNEQKMDRIYNIAVDCTTELHKGITSLNVTWNGVCFYKT